MSKHGWSLRNNSLMVSGSHEVDNSLGGGRRHFCLLVETPWLPHSLWIWGYPCPVQPYVSLRSRRSQISRPTYAAKQVTGKGILVRSIPSNNHPCCIFPASLALFLLWLHLQAVRIPERCPSLKPSDSLTAFPVVYFKDAPDPSTCVYYSSSLWESQQEG